MRPCSALRWLLPKRKLTNHPLLQWGQKAPLKKPTTIRLDADVLAALKATGDGWQTRLNEMVRASLRMTGQI